VTSQKSTVTTFRCSRFAGAGTSGAAQELQNRESSGFSRPHSEQTTTAGAYDEKGRRAKVSRRRPRVSTVPR